MTFTSLPPQVSSVLASKVALLVTVDSPASGRPVVRVRGELDMATAALLPAAVHRAAGERDELELDLSGLAFCDVVGLTAIEHVCRRLADAGCQVSLHGIEGLRALVEVLGLFDLPLPTGQAQPPAGSAATPT